MTAWPSGWLMAAWVSPQVIWGGLWIGLGMLTIALVTLMVTRWGQAQPLNKCIVLSVWAHVLLAVYASSVNIMFKPAAPPPIMLGIHIADTAAAGPSPGEGGGSTNASNEPWAQFSGRPAAQTVAKGPPRPTAEVPLPHPVTPKASTQATALLKPARVNTAEQPNRPASPPAPATQTARAKAPAPVSDLDDWADGPTAGPPAPAVAKQPNPPVVVSGPQQQAEASATVSSEPAVAAVAASTTAPVPIAYALRSAPDRAQIVAEQGGSPETEAAVHAALKWLAGHQSPDGRWDANLLEAGRESKTLGQDRRGAGTEADTGMTGLALLAFLASGHSHQSGDYRSTVSRGLDFLVSSQAADGSLGGRAEAFAFMYCHAMAGLAISEACGMTADTRWREPVRRAVAYTLACQNRTTGGWRYRPQDVGDTSQLGWQWMFLKSAGMAGVPTPPGCRDGIERYLQSVASGRYGGLAAYRPGQDPTRTMTAEALVCRLFLGQQGTLANVEAADYLLGQLPGKSEVNFYYWYYATLGLYQVHDTRWRRWNEAVATELVRRQRRDASAAGSWDPDPVWGSYGGRVYSTALAALCLEVYYRFLPLYIEAASRTRRIR